MGVKDVQPSTTRKPSAAIDKFSKVNGNENSRRRGSISQLLAD
jgi:hypothetical protein